MLNQYQNINSYDHLLSGSTVDDLKKAISNDPSILTRKDANGSTLLHQLAIKGFKSYGYSGVLTVKAINLLINAPEGSVNVQDAKGLTPLHHQVLMALPRDAGDSLLEDIIIHEHRQVFTKFVSFAFTNKYNFSLADFEHGFTVFHLLAREKSLEAVDLLKEILEHPDFNDKDSYNSLSKNALTPLDLAITQGSLTGAILLINKGATSNKALTLLEDSESRLLKLRNEGKITTEQYTKRIEKITEVKSKITQSSAAAAGNRMT